MGNYNPRQNTRMRFKDERELEKFSFLYGGFDIQAEQLENVSQDENWSKVANLFKNYDKTANKKGVILYDYLQEFLCTGYLAGQYLYLYSVSETGVTYITIDYDIKIDSMRIYVEDETFISEDHVKTLFGQDITGTGNITMYRHQIIIRFDTDTKEVNYVVYSPSKAQIFDYDTFMSVAKPISNFNYAAVYVNGNNAEPAFIRFASGTILVGLSTGMEPFTGLADVVSET